MKQAKKHKLASCPKCGDELGFYTVLTEVSHQQYTWDGKEAGSSTISFVEGSRKRCLTCNKIVCAKIDPGE